MLHFSSKLLAVFISSPVTLMKVNLFVFVLSENKMVQYAVLL